MKIDVDRFITDEDTTISIVMVDNQFVCFSKLIFNPQETKNDR
ncbi:hypothetical protein D1AOALGA4SA_8382 [Olavius algarvensis Delta 1 endosymbiont]|nr:hypothetical protein D1AOALGA4SA_8382 [Olavius algarvensis Delta 1 endosymbiont]